MASGLGRQAPCRHCLASATGSLVEAPALLCPSLIRGLFSILSSSGLGVLVPEAHLQRSLVGGLARVGPSAATSRASREQSLRKRQPETAGTQACALTSSSPSSQVDRGVPPEVFHFYLL